MSGYLVLGLGTSGRAAAKYLLGQGEAVFGYDDTITESPVAGVQMVKQPFSFHTLIVSPGVPPTHPVYRYALDRNIPILGEAELALRNLPQKMIGITGTNGKTTTTLLLEHVFNACGYKAKAAGNCGLPLSDLLTEGCDAEILIVELSSYQLETLRNRAFEASLFINLDPDHLQRYESMEAYCLAKARIGNCIKEGGKEFVEESVLARFSSLFAKRKPHALCWEEAKHFSCGFFHDRLNWFAAWKAAEIFGIERDRFLLAATQFQKPPHRLEFVANKRGAVIYNDSKATNPASVVRAVEAMEKSVLLIAGGVDKGVGFKNWRSLDVRHAFLIGEAKETIAADIHGYFPYTFCNSLEDAVKESLAIANQGDVVLLSPGCSSFDQFRNYEHRGENFRRIVDAS